MKDTLYWNVSDEELLLAIEGFLVCSEADKKLIVEKCREAFLLDPTALTARRVRNDMRVNRQKELQKGGRGE